MKRRQSDNWSYHAKRGGVWAAVVAAAAALGIGSTEIKTLLDVQSASAAEQSHKLQRMRVDMVERDLMKRIERNHRDTTERLDSIYDAILEGRR